MATTVYTSNDDLRIFRKVETISTTTTLTAADSGKVFILDAAAGKVVTLPALKAGLNFKFIVGAAFATDNWVIDSAEGDNIEGIIADLGSTPAGIPATGEDQINFVASAEGLGDWVELVCDYDNSQWIVTGMCRTNGGITVTDPS
jgi:hypothetical protein